MTKKVERPNKVVVVRSGGRALNRQQEALQAALNRIETLETYLFAFVWNRATYPLGRQLGKTDEEIADKTWETVLAAADMVDYPKMNELLRAARWRYEQKGAERTDEEVEEDEKDDY